MLEVFVAMPDAPLYEGKRLSGEPQTKLPLGQRLKGRHPEGPGPWEVQVNGKKGYMPRKVLMRYPATAHTRYVDQPTSQLARPRPGSAPIKELKPGVEVAVVDVPGVRTVKYLGLVQDGVVKGFVKPKDLREEAPNVPQMYQEALTHLKKPDVFAARSRVREAVRFDPQHAGVLHLRAALALHEADDRGWRWKKEAPPPKPLPPLKPVKAVSKPGPAYVVASALRLRKRPKKRARTMGTARIGTEVEVKKVKGDWARIVGKVVSGGTARKLLGPFDELPDTDFALEEVETSTLAAPETLPPEVDRRAEGWVLLQYLDRQKPSVEALKNDGDRYLEKDEFDAAMLRYVRALALDIKNEKLARTLFDTAVIAERPYVALRALRVVQSLESHRTLVSGSMTVVFGCRGNPRKAELIRDSDLEHLPMPRFQDEDSIDQETVALWRSYRRAQEDPSIVSQLVKRQPLPKNACLIFTRLQFDCIDYASLPEIPSCEEPEEEGYGEQEYGEEEYDPYELVEECREEARQLEEEYEELQAFFLEYEVAAQGWLAVMSEAFPKAAETRLTLTNELEASQRAAQHIIFFHYEPIVEFSEPEENGEMMLSYRRETPRVKQLPGPIIGPHATLEMIVEVEDPLQVHGAFLAQDDSEAARFVQTVLDTGAYETEAMMSFEGPRLLTDTFRTTCPDPR